MSQSRHSAPMFVDVDNQATALTRLELGRGVEDGQRREAFVQNLVHDHPSLIPMSEIEPAFSPLISMCREMPTPAGYVDNVWITPWGGIVLGEAKLVRNPQARREVVAQCLDYARAMAGWTYDDLQNAVRSALKNPAASLWALIEGVGDLGEAEFVDAVERRLRTGRLLLLIIGDGIQEGVEALTSHLQLHAGLHVGLALLDLSLWRGLDGGLIVVPRVPMRTVLIERGIVLLNDANARIDGVQAGPAIVTVDRTAPFTSSEAEFFDHLQAKRPDLARPLGDILREMQSVGVALEFGKSVVLRITPGPNLSASAGYIEANGRVWLGHAWSAANRAGKPEAGDRYLASMAAIIGGVVRRYERSPPEVFSNDGRAADAQRLILSPQMWKAAIAQFRSDLADLSDEPPDE